MSVLGAGVKNVANSAGLSVVDGDAMPYVLIPGKDAGDLSFTARRLGEVVSRIDWFLLGEEIIFFDHEGERRVMTPTTLRGEIMNHVVTCRKFDGDTGKPVPAILTAQDAGSIMGMPVFLRGVRRVVGVNRVRLPVVRPSGELELLPWGYDEGTRIYTVPGGLEYDEDIDIAVAKAWFEKYFSSFPFSDERSRAVQVAAMLALFIKHLLPDGCLRPGFLWLANKPGSGKSVQAKAGLYPVMGHAAAAKMKRGEDLDKELEAFSRASTPYLFLDNIYGGISSSSIDQLLTSEESTGRGLGGHGVFRAKNTMLLFATGNRLELNEDAQRRFLIVDLFEKGELADRKIGNPINDTVMKTDAWRRKALECLFAMVREWFGAGMPKGQTISPTFEDFSRVMGGIVTACGYHDPLVPPLIPDAISPDKVELVELLRAVLAEMGTMSEQDFTLEELAALARGQNIFVDKVGNQDQGRKLTIKEDGLSGDERRYAEDRGYLTPSQRSSWSKFLKNEVGGEKKVDGRVIEFGKRSQSRKTTYTLRIVS